MRALLILLSALALTASALPHVAAQGSPPAPVPQDYTTERALASAPRPARNLYELFPRLKGVDASALNRTGGSTAGWAVGATERFWVGNLTSREYAQRSARLELVTPEAYWWVEDGRQFDASALARAGRSFSSIAQKNRAVFGSEWTPGVDRDPRIVVLIASTPGAGGYFSSADEYPRAINPYSNQHEMIYIDAEPGTEQFLSTLAHEFQHMIHWYEHANQDVWLNEGMAEYAVELNGLAAGLPEAQFAAQPDTQLNTWADTPEAAVRHYGQSYRLMAYLAGRFQPEIMKRIILARGTSVDALGQAFSEKGAGGWSSVYSDWLAANYILGGAGSRFGYPGRREPVKTDPLAVPGEKSTTVSQWGADYYELPPSSTPYTLTLSAAARVKLIDASPRSGGQMWYSNRGDLLDSTLTREFDLSGRAAATLEVDMWYDIEKDYDYAYVEASADGGRSWTPLRGRGSTETNPNGNNLGHGFTGSSGGWRTERFDLTPFAGRKAQVRIEYVTDDGYNKQGIAVDGVRIPEIGYVDDSEAPGGWVSNGWVRSGEYVPGHYRLLLVDRTGRGGYTEVPVGADGRAAALIAPSGSGRALVVSGAAATTTRESSYSLSVTPSAPGSLGLLGARPVPAAGP